MGINNWIVLEEAEKKERSNLSDYLDELAQWSYQLTKKWEKQIVSRLKGQYINWTASINKKNITPDEIGILALACRKYKPTFPINNPLAEKEFIEYQYQLQGYLGMNNPQIMINFYTDLIKSIRPEHNKLIPTLQTHHTQIHALKIAYDALKWNIAKASITSRVIFWLICIELMTLGVRLYMVEPLARTPEWRNLDWIYMLDQIFEDFKGSDNRESMRRKNVVNIDRYSELWLMGAIEYIRQIRDEVDVLKRKKHGIPDERTSRDITAPVSPTDCLWATKKIQNGIKKWMP